MSLCLVPTDNPIQCHSRQRKQRQDVGTLLNKMKELLYYIKYYSIHTQSSIFSLYHENAYESNFFK